VDDDDARWHDGTTILKLPFLIRLQRKKKQKEQLRLCTETSHWHRNDWNAVCTPQLQVVTSIFLHLVHENPAVGSLFVLDLFPHLPPFPIFPDASFVGKIQISPDRLKKSNNAHHG
jgi:hypothetical protein